MDHGLNALLLFPPGGILDSGVFCIREGDCQELSELPGKQGKQPASIVHGHTADGRSASDPEDVKGMIGCRPYVGPNAATHHTVCPCTCSSNEDSHSIVQAVESHIIAYVIVKARDCREILPI